MIFQNKKCPFLRIRLTLLTGQTLSIIQERGSRRESRIRVKIYFLKFSHTEANIARGRKESAFRVGFAFTRELVVGVSSGVRELRNELWLCEGRKGRERAILIAFTSIYYRNITTMMMCSMLMHSHNASFMSVIRSRMETYLMKWQADIEPKPKIKIFVQRFELSYSMFSIYGSRIWKCLR